MVQNLVFPPAYFIRGGGGAGPSGPPVDLFSDIFYRCHYLIIGGFHAYGEVVVADLTTDDGIFLPIGGGDLEDPPADYIFSF